MPPWALVTSPPSPGYAIAIVAILLMTLFIVLSTFNFWWLSYWLEQGSGVSALDGVGGGGVHLWPVQREWLLWGLSPGWGPRDQPSARHCSGSQTLGRLCLAQAVLTD